MVMEEPPSPESVGREFVRQYYTLLNKAPIHLHRFYNHMSSFVHGGLDASDRDVEPVIGQKEIHNKIQQLNFRDCHAKISQVDSQATLGNGVVVQVTGELSNGGQPMRRFTQTFVLAAQSPKQYYVHNDIFRYQDFVFSEDDTEWGYSRSEESAPQQPPPAALPAPYFPPPPAVVPTSAPAPAPAPLPAQPSPREHAAHNGHRNDAAGSRFRSAETSPVPPGDFSPFDPLSGVAGSTVGDSSGGETETASREFDPEIETAAPRSAAAAAPTPTPTPVSEPAPAVSSEPKTYANLVKSGQSANFYVHKEVAAPSTRATAPKTETSSTVAVAATAPVVASARPKTTRSSRSESGSEAGAGPGPGGAPGGPGRKYSDSQQLFLGNVPHSATKEQLKVIFERFGAIVDLRLYNKQAGGPAGTTPNPGRSLPSYAFLTYEDPQSALDCLNAAPIYFPSVDAPDAQPLNVQEKKSRMGNSGGGGGGRGGGGGGARLPRSAGFPRRPYQPQRR